MQPSSENSHPSAMPVGKDPEQRPNEGPKPYAAFCLYLAMGDQRSLGAVATQLGKTKSLIARWSSQHKWTERVNAHLTRLAAEHTQAQAAFFKQTGVDWAQRQLQVREEEWMLHHELIQLARDLLQRYQKSDKTPPLVELTRLVDLASRLGRLSSGLPTDKTELTGSADGPPIRLEFEAMLQKIYSEPIDVETVCPPQLSQG